MPTQDITQTGPMTYREIRERVENTLSKNPNAVQDWMNYNPAKANTDTDEWLLADYKNPAVWAAELKDQGFGESRFDRLGSAYHPEYIDEIRGVNQSGLDQIKNGILKGAITTGTTFVNTIVGIPVGIGTAIAQGDMSGLWDNFVTRGMNSVEEWAEKELPNYYTQSELESPWYTNIFTANFLGDKLIKNFGFSTGAAGAGRLVMKAPKLISSLAPKIAKAAGRTSRDVKAIGCAANAFSTSFIGSVGEASIEALNATKEWSAQKTNEINAEYNRQLADLQREYAMLMQDAAEQNPDVAGALTMSLQAELNEKIALLDRQKESQMAQVASQRAMLGNQVFSLNLPLLTLSNMITFGKVYAGGWTAEQKALGKYVSTNMDNLALAGQTVKESGKKLTWKGLKDVERDVVKNVYENKLTVGKNVARGFLDAGKEGIYEEMGQATISTFAKLYADDYYAKSVNPDATDRTVSMWDAMGRALAQTYGNIDAYEEGFIGMLSGGISNVVMGSTREQRNERKQVQEWVDKANQRIAGYNSRAMIQGINRHQANSDDMLKAAIAGDKKAFKDAEFNSIVSDVIMFGEMGKLDDLKKIVDYSTENLSDEELDDIAESLSSEDSNFKDADIFKNMSYEEKRNYIKKQQDTYHKLIDDYGKERDDVVSVVGSGLSSEQLSEIVYKRLKAKNSAERYNELLDETTKSIKGITTSLSEDRDKLKSEIKLKKSLVQRYKDEYDTVIERSKQSNVSAKRKKNLRNEAAKLRKQIEFLSDESKSDIDIAMKILGIRDADIKTSKELSDFVINNLNEVISITSDNLFSGRNLLADMKLQVIKEIVKGAYDSMNPTSKALAESSIEQINTNIEDMIRLGADVIEYDGIVNEYLSNPQKIEEKNKGIRERVNEYRDNREADRKYEEIGQSKSFGDFTNNIQALKPSVAQKVLEKLRESGNEYAIEYSDKSDFIRYVRKFINESDVDTAIKTHALVLFDEACDTLPLKSLMDIDNQFYQRSNNLNLSDEEYTSVITLLAQAFTYSNDENMDSGTTDNVDTEHDKSPEEKKKEEKKKEKASDKEETKETSLNEEMDAFDAMFNEALEREKSGEKPIVIDDSNPTKEERPVVDEKSEIPQPVQEDSRQTSSDPLQDLLDSQRGDEAISQVPDSEKTASMGKQRINTKEGNPHRWENEAKYNKALEPLDGALDKGFSTRLQDGTIVSVKGLDAYDNVDKKRLVKRGSIINFGLYPSLDRAIKAVNNHDTTTLLMFIDGQCVGHVSEKEAKYLGVTDKLLDEFKGKMDTDEPLISKRYFTVCDEVWEGFVLWKDSSRYVTKDDLEPLKDAMSSSSRNREQVTPIIAVSDGGINFNRNPNNEDKFIIGTNVSSAHLNNKLFEGSVAALVPTADYDPERRDGDQSAKAYTPVRLDRVKCSELPEDHPHIQKINSVLQKMMNKPNTTVAEFNNLVGQLKQLMVYNHNNDNTEFRVSIKPARFSHDENDLTRVKLDEDGTPVLTAIGDKYLNAIKKSDDEVMYNGILIYTKVGDKETTFKVFTHDGTIQMTNPYNNDSVNNNVSFIKDILFNQMESFVNINKNRLDDKGYIEEVFEQGLLKTNVDRLEVVANSFKVKGVFDAGESNNGPAEEASPERNEDQTAGQESTEFDHGLPDFDNVINDTVERPKLESTRTSRKRIDIEKEIDNICRMLPQLDRRQVFDVVETLIDVDDKNEKAMGLFRDGLIKLSKLAQRGTGYHEAFHLVFNCILDKDEKRELLDEYRKIHKDAYDDVELEEYMADDFADYVLTKEEPKSLGKKIVNWFKKLYNIVFGYSINTPVFDAVAKKIYTGEYADRKVRQFSGVRTQGEYIDEMKAIKAKSIADGTFMKAPNGKDTNLTERQWLQVRTKAFKDWFGDWLGNPFAESVSIDGGSFNPDNVDGLGYRPEFIFRKSGEFIGSFHFEEYIKGKEGEVANNTPYLTFPEVGRGVSIEPEFRRKGLGKAMYYEAAKFAARKGKTLRSAHLDSVSESAKRVWDSLVKSGYAILEDNHYIFNNNKLNFSKVVDENGEPLVVYHGTTVPFTKFDKSKQNSRFPFGSGTDAFYFTSKKENAEKIAIGVHKGDFLINGEPLYKSEYPWGYPKRISEIVGYKVASDFESLMEGAKDLYSKEVIEDYFNKINKPNTTIQEIQESSDNVMPVFLNIKNMDIKDYEGKNLMNTSSKEFDSFVNNSKEGGKLANIKDGSMKLADTYFVKEPNQIKSATDNIGTFSRENNDIRYKLADQEYLDNLYNESLERLNDAFHRMSSRIDSKRKKPVYRYTVTTYSDSEGKLHKYEVANIFYKEHNQIFLVEGWPHEKTAEGNDKRVPADRVAKFRSIQDIFNSITREYSIPLKLQPQGDRMLVVLDSSKVTHDLSIDRTKRWSYEYTLDPETELELRSNPYIDWNDPFSVIKEINKYCQG